MAEDARERIVRYIQDAHAAEVGIEKMLEGFLNDTNDQSIRAVFQEHIVLTRSQAQRLETRLRALGETPSAGKGFFNGLMAKVSELMHGAHDEFDSTTQNLIKAYATEHLERGMYESMYSYASAVGDTETATLAREIQTEEEQTGERLFPLIAQYAKTALAATEGMGTTGASGAYPA